MGLLVMSVAQLITHLTKTNMKRQRLRQGSQLEETKWDISYPGGENDHDYLDYFWFSYDAVLQFLWEITRMDRQKSYTFHCDKHIQHSLYEIEQVKLIWTDFAAWRKREKFLNNIKPIIFAHVELLELPYPTSRICTQVTDELNVYFAAYTDTFSGDDSFNLIAMNLFTNLGTMLANMVRFDGCFKDFDGVCVGSRLGMSTAILLDKDVVDKWAALENNELYRSS